MSVSGQWVEGGERWLCLYFPTLAIDYWQRQQAEPAALALHEGARLVMCSGAARLAGVEAGMSLASAQALLPTIVLRPYEPAHEQSLLQALAQWAYGFTSSVMLEPPHRLVLELAASLRLFGGLAALLARLSAELQAWGCEVALGLAPTAAGARLLAVAQSAEGHPELSEQQRALAQGDWPHLLASQPLARLPLAKASLQRLRRAGFQTVGELLAVPLASVGRRFDQPLVQLLRQLQGLSPELAQAWVLAPEFNRSHVFMYGLTDSAHLQAPMQALLAELKQFLRQRQLVTQGLCWRFVHVDRQVSELSVGVQRAHGDTDEFLRLTQLKLEQFRMCAPVEVVGLRAEPLTAAEPAPVGLFPELRDASDEAGRLIDRLYQRLSPAQLFSVQLQDEHLPEYQQRPVRVQVRRPTLPAVAATGLLSPWLYPDPLPLQQRRGQLVWQGEILTLVSLAERMDSHWWAERQRRDYFVARAGNRYVRIFFCHQRQQWFVAGCYVC